jgi:hypothetical protein
MQVIGERCTGDEGATVASAVCSLGYKPHCSACGLEIDISSRRSSTETCLPSPFAAAARQVYVTGV